MGVVRKRRTPGKRGNLSSTIETERLRAESAAASVHDESDTLSFRTHLLANYTAVPRWLGVLCGSQTPRTEREARLRRARERVQLLQDFAVREPVLPQRPESTKAHFPKDLEEFARENGLRVQAERLQRHVGAVRLAAQELPRAPQDYWELRSRIRERALQPTAPAEPADTAELAQAAPFPDVDEELAFSAAFPDDVDDDTFAQGLDSVFT